jgi:hypothetical protein
MLLGTLRDKINFIRSWQGLLVATLDYFLAPYISQRIDMHRAHAQISVNSDQTLPDYPPKHSQARLIASNVASAAQIHGPSRPTSKGTLSQSARRD